MIIDGDGHVGEPLAVWTDYLSPEFYPRFHFSSGPTGLETLVVEDHAQTHIVRGSPYMPADPSLRPLFSFGDTMIPRGHLAGNAKLRKWEEGHPGGWQADERVKVHDAEGVDAAVLFTTLGLWVGSVRDPKVATAVAEALNRWFGDFCAGAPNELFGIATLPIQDPAAAAKELRRCVESYGFVAGTVRPNPSMDGRTLAVQPLDALWAEAQELDVPICLHSGSNGWQPFIGRDRVRTQTVAHIMDHAFEQMVAFGGLFEAGLFERFPRLRMGFMESSAGWAPWWIDRLEEHVETWGWQLPAGFKRSPGEVFHDQCAIGGEGEEPMIPYVQERLGNDKVVWASDFPHIDSYLPGLVSPVLNRSDLSPEQRDGFLAGAAINFYKLDVDRINKARAERQGSLSST
jgi:uncharacterized protein